jgi:hypothetical protein
MFQHHTFKWFIKCNLICIIFIIWSLTLDDYACPHPLRALGVLGYEGVSNHCPSAVSGSPDHLLLPMALTLEHPQGSAVDPSPPLKILQVMSIQIKVLAVHIIVFSYIEFCPKISVRLQ